MLDLCVCLPNGINEGDAKRFKMAEVSGQNRQLVMNSCGGDGDIREAWRKTRGSGITGQSSSDMGDLRSQRQDSIAVKIDDRVQPFGQSGGLSVGLSPFGEGDASLDLGDRHDG